MKVYNTTASTINITQYCTYVDDNVYFFLNGSALASPASITGSGAKSTVVTWPFAPGLNTVDIIWNNSGNGGMELDLTGDFFYQNTNLRFIGE